MHYLPYLFIGLTFSASDRIRPRKDWAMLYFLFFFVPLAPAALFIASLVRAASVPTPPVPDRKAASAGPHFSSQPKSFVGSNA